MKSLIFVVEDNQDILFNIKLILEANNFEVITAENGKEALELLSSLQRTPEIIISDIMMPEMDGYDFFKAVSDNFRWNWIPFIFLTARASPEDVRFAKMLGVDDYLTKPFNEEDLLAIIHGKLVRNKKIRSVNEKVNDLFKSLDTEIKSKYTENIKTDIILIVVAWDDRIGPELKYFYPKEYKLSIPLENLGQQLFQSTISIYGHDNITKSESLLLNIENIKQNGFIFFDRMPDKTTRTGERQYMIGVIAPIINYFETLRIIDIFKSLSKDIKKKDSLDMKLYWEKISNILLTSPLGTLDLES
ncbi:MAG: response regulator [Candidatus Hermodarchaeota archaeon]